MLRRVFAEIRADVTAARDRDPAAQGVSSFEILTSWAGVQALLEVFPAEIRDVEEM